MDTKIGYSENIYNDTYINELYRDVILFFFYLNFKFKFNSYFFFQQKKSSITLERTNFSLTT